MKMITVRNVPDNLYRAIKSLARRNRRSIQQQVICLLDRARLLEQDSPVANAAKIRERLAGRDLGDSVTELREERRR